MDDPTTGNHGENGDAHRIYGELRECLHIAGYSAARAWERVGLLLDGDRWLTLKHFDTLDGFLRTLPVGEIAAPASLQNRIDERRERARKLAEAGAGQRAIAHALGVDKRTVGRDLGANAPDQLYQPRALRTKPMGSGQMPRHYLTTAPPRIRRSRPLMIGPPRRSPAT